MPILAGLAQLVLLQVALAQQAVTPPPNDPATVAWDASQGKLALRYHGSLIFDGMIRAEDAAGKAVAGAEVKFEPAETRDPKEKVEQHLKFSLAKPQEGVKLVLGGTATGSEGRGWRRGCAGRRTPWRDSWRLRRSRTRRGP